VIRLLAPEVTLVVVACALLLLGLSGVGRRTLLVPWLAASAVVVAFVISALQMIVADGLVSYEWFPYAFGVRIDNLTHAVRCISLAVGLLILLVNLHLPSREERGECCAMVLLSLAGIGLVAVADDWLLLFFALELVSVPTYVLVAGSSTDARAQEAGVKYFFLGAMSAALTVYGLSFLFGAGGTTTIIGPDGSLAAAQRHLDMFSKQYALMVIGLSLVLAGIAFKMAAVPFHFYAADVYEGAASPVTGLLGFVPKIAGVVAIVKLLTLTGWRWHFAPELFWLIWVLAAATMTVGNVIALLQGNVKRILAYSSIAHSGYLLVGLLTGVFRDGPMNNGIAAVLFYIAAYGVTNLGAFAILSYLEHRGRPVEQLSELAGLSREHPFCALGFAICLFSLMGMPPTAGFLGKVFIFSSALSSNDFALITLGVLGVLNSAVAAVYYLRMIAACYLREPTATLTAPPRAALESAIAVCAALVLLLGIMPRGLIKLSSYAARPIAQQLHPNLPPVQRKLSEAEPDTAEPTTPIVVADEPTPR
jgi:NADH-quinone oxidoreductase subunit N